MNNSIKILGFVLVFMGVSQSGFKFAAYADSSPHPSPSHSSNNPVSKLITSAKDCVTVGLSHHVVPSAPMRLRNWGTLTSSADQAEYMRFECDSHVSATATIKDWHDCITVGKTIIVNNGVTRPSFSLEKLNYLDQAGWRQHNCETEMGNHLESYRDCSINNYSVTVNPGHISMQAGPKAKAPVKVTVKVDKEKGGHCKIKPSMPLQFFFSGDNNVSAKFPINNKSAGELFGNSDTFQQLVTIDGTPHENDINNLKAGTYTTQIRLGVPGAEKFADGGALIVDIMSSTEQTWLSDTRRKNAILQSNSCVDLIDRYEIVPGPNGNFNRVPGEVMKSVKDLWNNTNCNTHVCERWMALKRVSQLPPNWGKFECK